MLKRELGPEDEIAIETFLAIQINNLSDSVNIAANLNFQPEQIPEVARALVLLFPVESLEDFVLCFRRGAYGFYGTIYKLDASVLCDWMKKYLDEKYQLIETREANAKVQFTKENEINYNAFKERAAEFVKRDDKGKNFMERHFPDENDYQRWKIENPLKEYNVRGLILLATSQQAAEAIVQRMIESGEVEEIPNNEQQETKN